MMEIELELDLIDDDVVVFDEAGFVSLVQQGDIEAAAQLYETAPMDAVIEPGRFSGPSVRTFAEVLEQARDFRGAARAYKLAGDEAKAAAMYERGADYAEAAASFERAGDVAHAAAAHERQGHTDSALALLEEGGSPAQRGQVLARAGRFFEAAQAFREAGDPTAEVKALQQVPMEHPARVATTRRLSALMVAHGYDTDAAQLLADTLRVSPAAQADVPLVLELLRLLEKLGKHDQAAHVRAWHEARVGEDEPTVDADEEGEESIDAAELEAVAHAEGRANPFVSAGPRRSARSPVAYRTLKQLPMFADLSLVDMKDLYRISDQLEFSAGAALIEQGAAPAGLMAVVEGEVEISRDGTALNRTGAGAVLGEISLLRDAPTSATATASTDVTVLFISRDQFADFVYAHPEAAPAIFRRFALNLAERVVALSEGVAR